MTVASSLLLNHQHCLVRVPVLIRHAPVHSESIAKRKRSAALELGEDVKATSCAHSITKDKGRSTVGSGIWPKPCYFDQLPPESSLYIYLTKSDALGANSFYLNRRMARL